ncbi:SLC13 family permease [Pseudomonas sp. OIL-1]|uniref:SLC13 family permease n=1 Tax=Pseudomonas sp. OIL-1 TaxID=2706126 RepID=UPI0013A781C4|nr:SLC13 family permease [Pseudomonas sp. OIL-1]QIB49866.1 SLC13 family permease [Pseudomonas sp. OIL-1]
MTTDQALIFAILGITICLFIWGRWRHDVVALAALLACVITGLTPSAGAFSGFGNPAVITVAAVLVLSYGLQSTGAVEAMAQRILPKRGNPLVSQAALVLLGALLSAFMNNVGAMALTMPIAIQLAARQNIAPGKILMPLAFGTILGGMTTLIGTPPNLIVAGFRESTGNSSFAMFDFAPVGVTVALCGVIFSVLAARWLVPARTQANEQGFDTGTYLTEVKISADAKAVGRTIRDIEARLDEFDAQIVGLVRDDYRVTAPYPGRMLRAGDILVIEAEPEELGATLTRLGLKLEEEVPTAAEASENEATEADDLADEAPVTNPPPVAAVTPATASNTDEVDPDAGEHNSEDTKPRSHSDEIALQELVIQPGSPLIGHSASDMQIRSRYSINLLAISRKGHRSIRRLRSTMLEAGDVLLMQGRPESTRSFATEHHCIPLAQREILIPNTRKAYTAIGLMVGSVLLAAFGILPAEIAFSAGVLGYMLTKVVPLKRIYDAVDWPIIVLLGALFPLAGAMAETGAADLLAKTMLDYLAQGNSVAALTLILVITMTLSGFMNNAATAAVMCPISLSIAQQLQVNPDSLLMAVAIGASCAFVTPIGHQNNTLILGPGGFRFGDYWRMGLPLEILVVLISVPMLLVVWPL